MKNLLKLEELAIFIICIIAFNQLKFSWWWLPTLLLLPDIGMLGYVISNKVGAIMYNIFHHRFVATIVLLYAYYSNDENLKLVSIILFAHISMDRFFGYGLKFNDSFYNTHLGKINNKNKV